MTQIDNAFDRDTRRFQIKGGLIGAVMCGGDNGTTTRTHAIAIGKNPRSIGKHNTRTIIVRKHQRTLMRAGGNHHFFCTHLPQTIAWQFFVGTCEMIGHAFNETDKILREITKGLRARKQRHRA